MWKNGSILKLKFVLKLWESFEIIACSQFRDTCDEVLQLINEDFIP